MASIYLFIDLYIHLSMPSIYVLYLSIYLSIYLNINFYIYLSMPLIYLSIYTSIHALNLSIYLSIHLSRFAAPSDTYLPVVISILIFVMIVIFLGLAVGIAFCIRGNSKKMMNKSESLQVNSYVKHSQTVTYEPTSPKPPNGQHSISMQQESVIYEQIIHNVILSQEPNSKTSTV